MGTVLTVAGTERTYEKAWDPFYAKQLGAGNAGVEKYTGTNLQSFILTSHEAAKGGSVRHLKALREVNVIDEVENIQSLDTVHVVVQGETETAAIARQKALAVGFFTALLANGGALLDKLLAGKLPTE